MPLTLLSMMLSATEKRFLRDIDDAIDLNYERVIKSRVRKKTTKSIRDIMVVCNNLDRLSPDKGGETWDRKIKEICQRLL